MLFNSQFSIHLLIYTVCLQKTWFSLNGIGGCCFKDRQILCLKCHSRKSIGLSFQTCGKAICMIAVSNFGFLPFLKRCNKIFSNSSGRHSLFVVIKNTDLNSYTKLFAQLTVCVAASYVTFLNIYAEYVFSAVSCLNFWIL